MKQQLKILMICHESKVASITREYPLARQLVQRGHEVTLLVVSLTERTGCSEFEWDGIRTVETPSLLGGRLHRGWDPWNALNRILFLSRDQETYDLVHCFETRPSTIYPALYYTRQHKRPLVTDWIDWWGRKGLIEVNRPWWYRILFGWVETYYEEAFRSRAAGLTVISTGLIQRAIKLGVRPELICHITGGSLPDLFQAHTIEECRKRVGFPLSEPILGFSSINSHLDMEIVFDSLAIVARKYPSIKLIVTGKPKDSVRKLARKIGVEDHIYFVGALTSEDLPWYLGCANVFLLPFPDKPYNIGRWPNKMNDYLYLGRPTVSNPVGDIKILFEKHSVGCLAEWDPDDFAEKIVFLLENPQICAELGQNAIDVAKTDHNWENLAIKLENFYFKILEMERK